MLSGLIVPLIEEGGLGIHFIRLANASLLCKLTWDILPQDGPSRALRYRYFHEDRTPQNFRRASFIWSGIWAYTRRLNEGSFWLIGCHSKVKLIMDG